MSTFETSRTVTLPRSADFFRTRRRFDVVRDDKACNATCEIDNKPVNLKMSKELAPYLDAFKDDHFDASLEEITAAAMQFFRGEDTPKWPAERYNDKLFQLRYDMALAYGETSTNSLAQLSTKAIHSEVRGDLTELYGYGISVALASHLLKISPDRFFFLQGREARPDFSANVTEADVLAFEGRTFAIPQEGFIVGLEAKGLGQHSNLVIKHGKNKGKPSDELASMIKKARQFGDNAFLGIMVTTERRQADLSGQTKIMIADPGQPQLLAGNDLSIALLRCAAPRLRRFGLWATLVAAADWLKVLGDTLSAGENSYLASLPPVRSNAFLNELEHEGAWYVGRFFSDVVRTLGPTQPRQPALSREEIQRRINTNDPGPIWYCGVLKDYHEIVSRQDGSALATTGVGPAARTVFLRVRSDDALTKESVMGELRAALRYAT